LGLLSVHRLLRGGICISNISWFDIVGSQGTIEWVLFCWNCGDNQSTLFQLVCISSEGRGNDRFIKTLWNESLKCGHIQFVRDVLAVDCRKLLLSLFAGMNYCLTKVLCMPQDQ